MPVACVAVCYFTVMNNSLQSIMIDLKNGTDAQDHASLLCYHLFDNALYYKSSCMVLLEILIFRHKTCHEQLDVLALIMQGIVVLPLTKRS